MDNNSTVVGSLSWTMVAKSAQRLRLLCKAIETIQKSRSNLVRTYGLYSTNVDIGLIKQEPTTSSLNNSKVEDHNSLNRCSQNASKNQRQNGRPLPTGIARNVMVYHRNGSESVGSANSNWEAKNVPRIDAHRFAAVDMEAGRYRSLEEVDVEIRQKHNFPSDA